MNFLLKSIFTFLFLFASFRSFGQSGGSWICDSIFRSTNYGCSDFARSNVAGGSYPQLFDAFNINPSSIPTTLTPIGLELFTSSGDFNIAMIKGQGSYGTAFSSSDTNGNFFSNVNNYELTQTASQTRVSSTQGNFAPNLNIGFSFPLFGTQAKSFSPVLGVSLKRNKDTGTYKQTAGLSLNTNLVHGGLSLERDSNSEKVFVASLGAKIWKILFDYSYFDNLNSPYSVSDRTHIFSGTLAWGNLEGNYAYRRQTHSSPLSGINYSTTHHFLGLQYRVTNKVSFALYRNYILDTDYSFALKIFF